MRRVLFASWFVCFAGCAQAQLSVPISEPQAQVEQTRISTEREGLEAQYASQEAQCYQRFAVTDCLRDVRAHKRVSLETLRRQEIVLKDIQRKTIALEQAQQAQEKTSAAAFKQEADTRASAELQHKERLDRAQQKKADAAQRATQADVAGNERPGKERVPAKGVSAQAQQAFEAKQRNAQERKAQRDKSLAEKSAKPVRPLPLNP